MKYGVREICDVVMRAKGRMTIGKYSFDKDMPVLYFDSLKTSSMEGASTTVYAQGGKGNTRLIAWEGEKTVTFTMEDALISPISLAILAGAEVNQAGSENSSKIVHATEVVTAEVKSNGTDVAFPDLSKAPVVTGSNKDYFLYAIPLDDFGDMNGQPIRFQVLNNIGDKPIISYYDSGAATLNDGQRCLIDYYFEEKGSDSEVTFFDITPESFGGNFYLEASTLWRDRAGLDHAAEFIIPNCKVQSNFTFSMASSGDPSTFTFTLDAFPDYPKHNKKKKVLAAIEVVETVTDAEAEERRAYPATYDVNETTGSFAYKGTEPTE